MKRGHIEHGIGFSDIEDSHEAGKKAAQQALDNIVGDAVTFALVYMTTDYDHGQVIAGAQSVVSCDVAGVSSCHIIASSRVSSAGVCVVLFKSSDIHFSGLAAELKRDVSEREQMSALMTQLIDGNIGKAFSTAVVKVGKKFVQISPYTVFLLTSVSGFDGCSMIRGIQDVSSGIFQIVGGAPGDRLQFSKTQYSLNGRVFDNGALLLLLASKVPTGYAVANAWTPVGGAHVVTRASGNVVHEIDNVSASRVYESYLSKPLQSLQSDDFARMGIMNPMGIVLSYGDTLMRIPYRVDDDGSIVFNGSMREGCAIRFMDCDKKDIPDAARRAARQAVSSLGRARPAIVFAFISVADVMMLGEDVNDEIKAIQDVVGHDVPVVGFYTHGEYNREKVYSHKFYSNSISLFVIGH